MRGIGRNGAEHDVGMSADIFGAGLDDEIGAMIERPKIERRRPGIVDQNECLNRIVPHLRRSISEYLRHCHAERNHQGLGNVLIERGPTPANTNGVVRTRQRLGQKFRAGASPSAVGASGSSSRSTHRRSQQIATLVAYPLLLKICGLEISTA